MDLLPSLLFAAQLQENPASDGACRREGESRQATWPRHRAFPYEPRLMQATVGTSGDVRRYFGCGSSLSFKKGAYQTVALRLIPMPFSCTRAILSRVLTILTLGNFLMMRLLSSSFRTSACRPFIVVKMIDGEMSCGPYPAWQVSIGIRPVPTNS